MAIWESCCFISYLCDRVNGPTSRESWLHFLKERLLPIENTDPRVRHDLMSCGDEEIDVEIDHIDSKVRESLTSIDYQNSLGIIFFYYIAYFRNICDCPSDIRCGRYAYEP